MWIRVLPKDAEIYDSLPVNNPMHILLSLSLIHLVCIRDYDIWCLTTVVYADLYQHEGHDHN